MMPRRPCAATHSVAASGSCRQLAALACATISIPARQNGIDRLTAHGVTSPSRRGATSATSTCQEQGGAGAGRRVQVWQPAPEVQTRTRLNDAQPDNPDAGEHPPAR